VSQPALSRALPPAPLARFRVASSGGLRQPWMRTSRPSSLMVLQTVARRYSRQMQREVEGDERRLNWERTA